MFTPAPTTANSVSFDAIDAYVEEQMRHLHIPGVSLAIVEGDRLVHLHGFGKAQPGGRPPTPQTPFLIGSLTKSITALAVMQAVEAGKIELDAPVQRYLPWFRVMDPQASAQMTVRHLLVQTSGLPASAGESILAHIDNSPGAAERQARALSSLVPAHPVGDTFEYSNSNYQLLGLIIEAVTGKAYADYVQNSILTPLRMNHSHYPDPTGAKNGLAMGHQYWFGRPVEAPDIPLPYGAMAAGLLISTAEDLAHYLIAHLNIQFIQHTCGTECKVNLCSRFDHARAAGRDDQVSLADFCSLQNRGFSSRCICRVLEIKCSRCDKYDDDQPADSKVETVLEKLHDLLLCYYLILAKS